MSEELERVYTINLGKVLLSQPQHRAVRALNMIREFARRHMKTQSIKIDEDLARQVWSRGARSPPRKIRVRMNRTDLGDILVTRYDGPMEGPDSDVDAPLVGDSGAAAAAATGAIGTESDDNITKTQSLPELPPATDATISNTDTIKDNDAIASVADADEIKDNDDIGIGTDGDASATDGPDKISEPAVDSDNTKDNDTFVIDEDTGNTGIAPDPGTSDDNDVSTPDAKLDDAAASPKENKSSSDDNDVSTPDAKLDDAAASPKENKSSSDDDDHTGGAEPQKSDAKD